MTHEDRRCQVGASDDELVDGPENFALRQPARTYVPNEHNDEAVRTSGPITIDQHRNIIWPENNWDEVWDEQWEPSSAPTRASSSGEPARREHASQAGSASGPAQEGQQRLGAKAVRREVTLEGVSGLKARSSGPRADGRQGAGGGAGGTGGAAKWERGSPLESRPLRRDRCEEPIRCTVQPPLAGCSWAPPLLL